MNKELIIHSSPTDVDIAMLEDGKLVEIHRDKTNSKFTVGDIFLGRVKKTVPGLNAAFLDIGHRRDAFLHYTDLGPKLRSMLKFTRAAIAGSSQTHMLDDFKLEPEIVKTGKINEVLSNNQPVLVQILKEPISTKGPRLSCEITIPGRYLVISPFNENTVSVSKKIPSKEERHRLKLLVESIKPQNFGVIVRTAAEGKKVAELHEELNDLLGKWKKIHDQLHRAKPPLKLLSELDKASSMLRDMLNDSFNRIVVDDRDMYHNIKSYLKDIAPDKAGIVKGHRSNQPIFDRYGVTKQIKASFGKTATMDSGAYIVIEHTEAMHVIDVNSGPKMRRKNQETAALNVNMEAAEEIARQLRLRDIGGLIIIDFIDMRHGGNKKKLYQAMRNYMKKDRAQHTLLPLSKFGLMQVTRERVRPAVKIDTAEVCPTCNGSGKVNPTILLTDEIDRDLKFILQSRPNTKIRLEVHPFVHAYLKRGFPNKVYKWFFKYSKWITVRKNNDLALTEYTFYDGNGEEIRLN